MIQVLSFPRLAWAGPSCPGLNNKNNTENQAHQQMKKKKHNTYSNIQPCGLVSIEICHKIHTL